MPLKPCPRKRPTGSLPQTGGPPIDDSGGWRRLRRLLDFMRNLYSFARDPQVWPLLLASFIQGLFWIGTAIVVCHFIVKYW